MSLRVAVVGGGPAGASAAEVLAQAGIETFLFERKLDNAKPCGGAIPLCMVSEFDLPEEIIDRKVRKMKMISPSNYEVDIALEKEGEYIGMCRREVLDAFLRNRARQKGAELIHGKVMHLEVPQNGRDPYVLHYVDFSSGLPQGVPRSLTVDVVIGADGFHSKVAEAIGAGDYNYALAFQERIRLPEDKMAYYEERAEMYVGDDVSPDFYAWVFPHGSKTSVGTGSAVQGFELRKAVAKLRDELGMTEETCKTVRVEGAPIPLKPRKRWDNGRDVIVAGDAAGTVAPASGEGIYYAMTAGREAARAAAEALATGDARKLALARKRFMKAHGQVFLVLGIMQWWWYRSDTMREKFVKLCMDKDIQQLTWEAYMNKELVRKKPLAHVRIFLKDSVQLISGIMSGGAVREAKTAGKRAQA